MNTFRQAFSKTVYALTAHTLDEIVEPLLSELRTYKAFPFTYPNNPKRFRTTVQSTCLLSLNRSGLLSADDVVQLHESILYFKGDWHQSESDFQGGLFNLSRQPEDEDSWCQTETPSVWSTAYAIWGLLESGFIDSNASIIQPSLNWLIAQQDVQTGGYPFQMYRDCIPTVYLSCLALKALTSSLSNARNANLSSNFLPKIELSIERAIKYINSCKYVENGVILFRPTNQEPNSHRELIDWISTIWAYRAVIGNDLNCSLETPTLFKLLESILNDNGKSVFFWENDSFLVEGHTKYGSQKTFFYFMPSLLIPLLDLGLSSLDRISEHFLKKLKSTFTNPGWRIPRYRRRENCTFVTALSLQTLHTWTLHIPGDCSKFLIDHSANELHADLLPSVESEKRTSQKSQFPHFSWFAFITYTALLITTLVTPWAKLFSDRNPLLMLPLFISLSLATILVILMVNVRTKHNIIVYIGIFSGLATLVGTAYMMLPSRGHSTPIKHEKTMSPNKTQSPGKSTLQYKPSETHEHTDSNRNDVYINGAKSK